MKRHLSVVATLAVLLLVVLTVAGCTRDSVPANVTAPIVEAAARERGEAGLSGPAELQAAATVAISPASTSVALGQTTLVEVVVQNVTGLYGVDVRLSFDPTRLEVQDANPGVAGVQIEPGPFLDVSQGFVAQNTADNTQGRINYAMSLLSPAAPVNGTGVVMRITFKGIAAGQSAVTFASVLLSDRNGTQIPSTTVPGTVTVTAVQPTATPTSTPVPGATATPTSTPVPGATATPTPPPGPTCIHIVRYGDTLYSIARRYGTTVAALVAANNIRNPNFIWVGQRLVIPGCVQPPPPPPSGCFQYVVRRGDTLYGLAARYGTTAADIAARNGIRNWNFIWVGQRLTICPGVGPVPPAPPVRYHTVRWGETLWSIALRYGTTPWAIATVNNIPNPNLIYAGQVLRIP